MLFDEHRKAKKTHVDKISVGNIGVNQSYYADLKSREPELVIKVASNIKNSSARDVMDYISRNQNKNDEEDYLSPEDELGNELKKEDLEKLSSEWSEEFGKETKHSRKMTHFVVSIDVEKTQENENKLKDATRDFLRERFGDEGFRYTFVVHNDTKHLHAHVVVNNNNLDTGKKLRVTKEWLQESRIMAKKHLSEHGIEQRATLKKDRQYFEKNIDAELTVSEREFEKVSSWVEAKLKSSARNSEHFQQIKTQYELVNEARQKIKAEQKDAPLSQESIELREKIRLLHKAMTLHDRLNSDHVMASHIAQSQFREVMKQSGIDEAMTERARETRAKQQNQAQSDQRYKLTNHARELVETEFIVRESQAISKEQKKEMLQGIKERKKELTTLGVDVKRIEHEFNVKMRSSDAYLEVDKTLGRNETLLKKEQGKEQFDSVAAEKRLVRALDELHKVKPEQLNKRENESVEQRKKALMDGYKALGLDTDKLQVKWQKHRETQDNLNQIKAAVSSPGQIEGDKVNQIQKDLFKAETQIEEAALNKKELYSMRKSIETQQARFDEITGSNFSQHRETLAKAHFNLNTLDKKIAQGDNQGADRQKFAMAKAHIQTANAIESDTSMSEVQRNKLTLELQRNAKGLEHRGVDLETFKAKQAVTQSINKDLRYLEGLDMKRVSGIQFDVAQKAIDNTTASLKDSDLNVTAKRDIKRTVKQSQDELNASRQIAAQTVQERLKQLEALSKRIESLSDRKHTATLSPSAKLQNRREIEKLGKDLKTIADTLKKDYPAISNQQERQTIKKQVESYSKQVAQSLSVKR